jgi:PAS domain S-box-containing protein
MMANALLRTIKPPKDFRHRIRWLFVIGSLFSMLLLVNELLFVSEAPIVQRALAVALLAVYAAETVRCYVNTRWGRYVPFVEFVTLTIAAITIGHISHVLAVFYIGMYFRILYHGIRELTVLVLTYVAAYLAGALVAPLLHNGTSVNIATDVLPSLAGFVVFGYIKLGLTASTVRHEGVAARERYLARAAAAIMAATDRAAIESAGVDGARALLRRSAIQQIALNIGGNNTAKFVFDRPVESSETADALDMLAAQISLALERVLLIEQLALRDRGLGAATSPVAIVDARRPERPVQYTNPAFDRLFGYAANELLGESLRRLGGPETDPAVQDQLTRVAMQGLEESHELAAYRKDGTRVWLEIAAAPVRGTDGGVTHCVWTFTDITARKQAEQQADARAHAEKLRALGQMASGIAHDLNQSLMLIASHGNLGLRALNQHPVQMDELRDSLTVVTQAAVDGGETVKRMLVFAQAPTKDALRPLDLTQLARDVIQLTAPRWRDEGQAQGRPIELQLDATGHPVVMAPQQRLREALMNLVMNAVDALPKGGNIGVRVFADDQRVHLHVSDDGIGMSPTVQARIFEPFFTTKGDSGTGLGLAAVYGLMESLNGRIQVHSEPGVGTRFELEFPRAAVDTIAEPARPKATQSMRRQLRVLAVDDEPAITRAVVRLLRPLGHVVSTADSAEQAMERLTAEQFDVVVSDVGMGKGMNGWELADRVRQEWPDVRFVLATGWGAAIDPVEAEARGVKAVLAKPYQPADLEQALVA